MKNRGLFTAVCGTLVVLAAAGPLPIAAQVARGERPAFRTYDFGRVSCGVWLEARASPAGPSDVRFVQAREWLSGFLTAYN
jgi:hypothetical protein